MDFKWLENGIDISNRIRPLSKSSRVSAISVRPEPDKNPSSKQSISPVQSYQTRYDRIPERKPAITANQIMSSPVVTLTAETSLDSAWQLICDRRFRHLPVVDRQDKLIGIISDRDILRQTAQICRHQAYGSDHRDPVHITIQTIMKSQVLTAGPQTEIRKIARILFEERIGSMPIINAHDSLAGIITRSDILRTLICQAPIELWI
ncbi:MAG: CBS domain-containing protein [Desulfobacterales bacterium]|nr:CBS domain-containing protein [Desulfobacterales bacterium]MDD4072598.1 CBS domain-containing protein [Desulfobacterales bacterium]MDD4391978.1 CBS domain-containing protein [Desulfobacterales bacterium]